MFTAIFQHHLGYLAACALAALVCGGAAWLLSHRLGNPNGLCGEVLPPRSPGKAVHRAFASAGQEAFFEGHVHALNVLGGVPTGKVRYDNLRAAVAQVLGLSRRRVEAERWTAFRSHYGIDALYCQPGIRGAHEKRRR